MKTPKASFFAGEGRVLFFLLWLLAALCLAGLLWVWLGSERAHPVMLKLESAPPVAAPVPKR